MLARTQRRYQLLFAILPLAILLTTAEVGLRTYDWYRGVSAHARAYWYWGFVQDRLLGYRSQPNLDIIMTGGARLDTNADGFRDSDVPIEPATPRRLILGMGESSTWGTGSSTRLTTWPHRLQQILSRDDPRLTVLNVGMPGYTTVENLQLLNLRLLKYHPEAVVYMGFRNDVEFYMRSLSDKTDLNFYPRRLAPLPPSVVTGIAMRSSFLAMLATRLGSRVDLDPDSSRAEAAPGARLTARGEQTFRDQIFLMKQLCERHGVKLLWVDQPIDYAKAACADCLKAARKILHDELSKDSIPLLRADGVYDYSRFPLVDEVHLNEAGSEHLATLLAPQILSELHEQAHSSSIDARNDARSGW